MSKNDTAFTSRSLAHPTGKPFRTSSHSLETPVATLAIFIILAMPPFSTRRLYRHLQINAHKRYL